MALKKIVIITCLILILLLLPIISIACDGYVDIVIENNTTKVLNIYSDEARLGVVEPSAQIVRRRIPDNSGPWLIVAKDAQGETVFSKKCRFQDMQYMGKSTYKVVIPPLVKGPESSSNITSK